MNNDPRQAILGSIRTHLSTSARHNGHWPAIPVNPENPVILSNDDPILHFKQNLENVNAHCVIAQSENEILQSLSGIITTHHLRRIAISDAPLVKDLNLDVEELELTPNRHDIFRFDAGITTAQAAIADTGTLVLESACERHRLVSLVPPVHIAIIDASRIVNTLGEALRFLREDKELSPTVTFITGPSRTADIELTLALGVHGPQELYVIVKNLKDEQYEQDSISDFSVRVFD